MKALNLGTAIYSLVVSIVFLFAPIFTFVLVVDDVANGNAGSTAGDSIFRIAAAIMIVLAIILLVKDKTSSTAGKVLILLAGAFVLLLSSFFGFVSGILGIIGASLLLASNKKYAIDENVAKE